MASGNLGLNAIAAGCRRPRTPLQTVIAGKEAWNEKVTNLNLI